MERCWCEEERAPCSTKGEKVSPLTEAQCARRRLGSSKREPVRLAANAMNKEHCLAGLPSR